MSKYGQIWMAFSATHGNAPFLVPPSVAPAVALASDPSRRLAIKT